MAERLTGFDYCFTRCMQPGADKQETREDCSLYKVCSERQIFEKLQRYEDLEEQGRLITLPCKIGDTVYYINTHNRLSLFKNTVYEAKVARFVTTRYGTSIVIQIRNEYGCTELYSEDNYNKTVFLTKEEAEAALKGAENDNL